MSDFITPKTIGFGIGAFMLFGVSLFSCEQVEEGHRGVKLVFQNAQDEVLEPGIHFKLPLVTQIKEVDVRQNKFEHQTSASSKDEQTVQTTIALNYAPKYSEVIELYSTLGDDRQKWEQTVLRPHIEEVTKSVTAKYKAKELITKRADVKEEITSLITDRLEGEYFTIIEVSITDFAFSNVYQQSIEAKQVAEQQAQRAINELQQNSVEVQKLEQQAEAEANATRTRAQAKADALMIAAQADADATRLRADADSYYHTSISKASTSNSLRNQEIEKWDGMVPDVVGTNSVLYGLSN